MGNEAQELAPALTVKETAALLKVSTKTVLNMIQRGQLPARKVGRAWRLSPRAVEAWLAMPQAEPKQD